MILASGKITVSGRKSSENGSSTPGWKIEELSGDFRPFSSEKNRNFAGRHRKNSGPEFPEKLDKSFVF
jgi:hypothetical protein